MQNLNIYLEKMIGEQITEKSLDEALDPVDVLADGVGDLTRERVARHEADHDADDAHHGNRAEGVLRRGQAPLTTGDGHDLVEHGILLSVPRRGFVLSVGTTLVRCSSPIGACG